jgi:hypothetical protein
MAKGRRTPLKGSDFVATRRLSWREGKSHAAGECREGQKCDQVPAGSLEGLLKSGKIEPHKKPRSRKR